MFSAKLLRTPWRRLPQAGCPEEARLNRRRRVRGWSNAVHPLVILHRKGAVWVRALPLGLVLAMLAGGAWTPLHAGPHASAAGWLQLEQDQRAYRERVAPLDLRERRALSSIQRTQRNDFAALEQRQRWSREQVYGQRYSQAPGVTPPPEMPPPRWRAGQHRAQEAQRLDRQMQQYRLPFGKRSRWSSPLQRKWP